MIKKIIIDNVKGISHKELELNIKPNVPNILVAPNGFGKSSISTAFKSLISTRINLEDEHRHLERVSNKAKIEIIYDNNGNETSLIATETDNSINSHMATFVINCSLKAKGIGSLYGRASATMEIRDIILVDRIPHRDNFQYSYKDYQNQFGNNSKVLPNIKVDILNNVKLIRLISFNYLSLDRSANTTIKNKIDVIKTSINECTVKKKDDIIAWINTTHLVALKEISYLNTIADTIYNHSIYDSEGEAYLAAIQLVWLYNNDKSLFKSCCKYSNYKYDKKHLEETITSFNTTGRNIIPSETGGKLILKFPKASMISNGQRDILTFVSMLFKARLNLSKSMNLLIIDEIFDYLDDANLVSAQYYITRLIAEYKAEGRLLYPVIMTHINPLYFNNFAFSNQRVCYLLKCSINVTESFVKLLKHREKPSIKDDVSKHLFHYHPDTINKRLEFRNLRLPELWGESLNFRVFIDAEVLKYKDSKEYDPFAVCNALRVKIEDIIYNKLGCNEHKVDFLKTHTTKKKLNYAASVGVESPESFHLLGLIYNDGMHWREGQDNVSPVASKLEHPTIKKMIMSIMDI